MRILVSGSLAYDRIMTFPGRFSDHILPDKIHILNVCFLVSGLEERFGGTAGNIAYNLALLGEAPLILSSAGKDFDHYEEWLRSHGLPLEGIRKVPEEFTAGAYITTDLSDNQITGFNPGAMKEPCGYDLSTVDPAEALAIVSPGNLDDMRNLPRLYREMGLPYIMDPGQNITAFTGPELTEMITGAFALVTNDYELELIMKSTGMDRAALITRTPRIITTLGEKGAQIQTRDCEKMVGPVATNTVDPTGAGDAFRAGLIKGLILGQSLSESCALGATCAAYVVERMGTQEHTFTLEEFQARYDGAFGQH
jgi:adenosine kinase